MDLSLLTPEIVLALWASGILLIDLILRDGVSRRPLLWLALLGLAVSAALTLPLLERPLPTTSFFGILVVDQFAIFFKLIFLAAAALVILAADTFIERQSEYETEFYGLLLFSTTGMMLMVA